MVRGGKVVATALLVVGLAAGMARGEDKADVRGYATVECLLEAVQSDMSSLSASAAFVLGDLRCGRAVIPLMRLLHDSPNKTVRIASALALCRIGDRRGAYAVKQAVRFDSSPKVQRLCAWFYNEHVQPDAFRFIPSSEPVLPVVAENVR
jgi:hypothetical protein